MARDPEHSQAYQKASDLLLLNQGLFIGERHDMEMAPEFLITHMADFKAQGVTTLYIEEDPQYISSHLLGNGCKEEYFGEMTLKPTNYRHGREVGYLDVIEEAARHGIRVIGSERIYATGPSIDARNQINEAGFLVANDTGNQLLHSPEAMENRDIFSAQLVLATRDGGKYIYYGGLNHSRNAGVDPHAPSAGVTELLGIPSIDFVAEEPFTKVLGPNLLAENDSVALAYVQYKGTVFYENNRPYARTVIEPENTGKATYVATNFQGNNYPEREIEHTKTTRSFDSVSQAMRNAGVCEQPPEGTLIRTPEDIPNIKQMVSAQYPERY